MNIHKTVIPAKAGTPLSFVAESSNGVPAFAGMTGFGDVSP
jgi:hypothetical protein